MLVLLADIKSSYKKILKNTKNVLAQNPREILVT